MSTQDCCPPPGIVTFFAGSKLIVERSNVKGWGAENERNAGGIVTGAVPGLATETSVAQNFRMRLGSVRTAECSAEGTSMAWNEGGVTLKRIDAVAGPARLTPS